MGNGRSPWIRPCDNGPMDELRHLRIVVRGHFAGLDNTTRHRLLDEADEHDITLSRFTREGWWVYDRSLVAFNFRYEVRVRGDESIEELRRQTEQRTAEFLDERGVPHKYMRSSVTDMSEMWR